MNKVDTLFIDTAPPQGNLSTNDVVLIDLDSKSSNQPTGQTLHDFYVKNSGHADFYSICGARFLEWAAQSRFLDQVTVNGRTLLCPLRWSFIQQLKTWVQKTEMIEFAIRTLQPRRIATHSANSPLAHLLKEISSKHSILFEIIETGSSHECDTLVSRILKGTCSRADIHSAVINKWHQVFTHRLTYYWGKKFCRCVGKLKLRLLPFMQSKVDVLFVSTLSNWQELFKDKPVRKEIMLGRMIEECRKNGKQHVVLSILDDQTLAFSNTLTQPMSTIPWDGIDSDKSDGLPTQPDLHSRLQKWAQKPETRQGLIHEGIDLSPLLVNHYAEAMEAFANEELKNLARSKKWIKALNPQIIFLISEHSSAASMVMAAEEAKIPTIGLAHAVTFPTMMMYMYSPDENLDLIPRCSKLCVWGKYEKELIAKHGAFYPDDRLIAVGSPKSHPTEEDGVRKALGIKSKLPIALCTSNNRHHRFAHDFLKQWQNCKDDFFLVVKMHPRELNYGQYDVWAKKLGIKNIKIIKQFDTLALISACDIHLSFSSTTVIEAAWLGKPTILFDEGLKNEPLEAVDMGVAYYLSDYKDFLTAIQTVLSSKVSEQFHHDRLAFLAKRFESELSPEELIAKELNLLSGAPHG